MEKCKYCQSENLYLEPKNEGEDVLIANQVALKCEDCGKWLKWVKKEDRKKYIKSFVVPAEIDDELLKKCIDSQVITVDAAKGPDICCEAAFAINVLKELRRELLKETVYYRSDVIGAIDRKIKKLGEQNHE